MPESIERILEALAPLLKSELSILGYSAHSTDRDDLLQEIRLRIWKAIRDKHGELEFLNAYIKRVVFSVFINEVNRLRQEKEMLCVAENEHGLGGEGLTDRPGLDSPLKQTVIESLEALGDTKQRVIRLRLQGFTFAEIALLQRWSLRKVCSLYYRGIREIKKQLSEKGVRCEG
jgi:RNA polymerase sigma factor (sigma-70 family)